MSKVIDVFPQVLRCKHVFTAGTYKELEVPTGLAALRAMQFRQNKRTAMEILKLVIQNEIIAGAGQSYITLLSTVSRTTEPNISDRGVLCKYRDHMHFVTSGCCADRRDAYIDLTCGGIGRLVTTDNLYLGANAAGVSGSKTLHAQIVFRYVSISLQEYSDIKESQITYE